MSEPQSGRDFEAPYALLHTCSDCDAVGRGAIHALQQAKGRSHFDEGFGAADPPLVLRKHGKFPSRAVVG